LLAAKSGLAVDNSRALRQKAEAAKTNEVSVISRAELDRIKAITKIETKEEKEMHKTLQTEQQT
jgi:hypothetical protein